MIKEQIRTGLYSFSRAFFSSSFGKQLDTFMQKTPFLKRFQTTAIAFFDATTKVEGEKKLTLANGTVFFVPRSGSYAALEIETTGKYEPEETELITKILKKGDTFVEIGGNIGYFSIVFSPIVGSEGKIITIEPSPAMVSILEKNKEANNAENMTIVPVAIGKEEGKISVGTESFHDMARISFENGTIPMKPFDMILDELHIDHIDVATLDIEGAEILALQGMEKVLKQKKIAKMMVEVNKGTLAAFDAKPIQLLEMLSEYFSLRLLESPEQEVSIEKLAQMADNLTYVNVWCVRK
ncbi:MAG: FkbM family methyltransferase [Candidatus Dojkabacteria bacterium]|nr:MAG: FkbM family methyltransferase [Candidatus Dojkabacteria bacterium]